MSGLYVLGCLERRVTLYSQQVRALNLAWALHGVGRIATGAKTKTRVAVVGAGAAGLTIAAAAAHLGAEVDVLERADGPMHLQMGCTTRWLHPRVYDWPAVGWQAPDADLPLLNWHAGDAAAVATSLVQGFDTVAERTSTLRMHKRVRNIELHRRGDQWRVLRFDGARNVDEAFDIVILAIGFGIERDVPFAPRLSYWRLDTLDQTPLDAEDASLTYLVSGNGDGGLIDVLRSHQRAFDHKRIIEDYLEGFGMKKIERRLLAIEKHAHALARTNEQSADAYLTEEYARLEVPHVDATLAERARSSVRVVLLGRSVHPVSVRSAIHNRFLVSRLLYGHKLGENAVQYRVGSLKSVEPAGFRFRGLLEGTTETSLGRVQAIEVDRVVVRHGAVSPLQRHFPEVWKRMTTDATPPDPTMPEPLWPKDFWTPHKGAPRRAPAAARRAAAATKTGVVAKDVRLVAYLELEDGVPRSFSSYDVRHYWIRLAVEGAPPTIASVTYHLYSNYTEPDRKVLSGPRFEETITSYGDFRVTARLSDGRRASALLSDALERGHPTPRPKAIATAIASIREN